MVERASKRVLNVFNESKEKSAIAQHRGEGYPICGAESVLEAIIQRKFTPPKDADKDDE